MMAQKRRDPKWPLGRKLMNIIPPIHITNMRIGVSQPQTGHIAKTKLHSIVIVITWDYQKKETKPATVIKGISIGWIFSISISFSGTLLIIGRYMVR